KYSLNRDGPQPLAADPRSLPSSGLITPGVGVQPTTQDRTQSSDSFILGGSHLEMPPAGPGVGMRGFSSVAPSSTSLVPSPVLNPPNPLAASLSGVPLEQAIEAQPGAESFGFVELKDNDTLPMAQTTVRVVGVLGGRILLKVNGHE